MEDDKKNEEVRLPPPSPAARAAMAQNISQSLAPPPKATGHRPNSIGQTEMKRTKQGQTEVREAQEQSIEIDLGDGKLASRQNPLSEKGEYIGKMPRVQKKEPAVLQPQARDLSANAARMIAKRRAMMEGQDQAGVFKLPGQGPDQTNQS